jgi:HlyD family secretion protein
MRFVLLALAVWGFSLWWTDSDDLFFRSFRSSPPAASAPAAASGSRKAVAATAKSDKPATKPDAIALEAKGYIIPAHQILVSPKVSGMIMKLCIEEGLRMQKGDVLAEIETTEYQAEFDRVRAIRDLNQQKLLELERGARKEEVEQARAELKAARETLAELKDVYDRQLNLKASQAATEQQFISAERRYFAQEQRAEQLSQALKMLEEGPRIEKIEAARAELRQSEADVARAKWRLDNCTIRAPISGTILKKNAEEGNIVNPVAFNGSFSLCDMADLADLEVSLDIQERDISKVFAGQKCTVRAEAFPSRSYEGYVDRLMPIADRAKGAIPVRVKVKVAKEEEGVYLKPEMGAIVTFLGSKPEPPAALPASNTPSQSASAAP